jgi:hypothetical protein
MYGQEIASLLPRALGDGFYKTATVQARSGDEVMGGPRPRFVTMAVRAPVRPAMLWMRVVAMASARVIAGRMVVGRRASPDLPSTGGPQLRRRTMSSLPTQDSPSI